MTYPDDYSDWNVTRLFREAEARDHAALEAEADRIRAANDRHPPLRRDLIWQSPLLIAAATVALAAEEWLRDNLDARQIADDEAQAYADAKADYAAE